jgi:hypothetical protein
MSKQESISGAFFPKGNLNQLRLDQKIESNVMQQKVNKQVKE